MAIDRIDVISLDRTPERFASFLRRHEGFPIERFPAVDGRTLDRRQCIGDGLITDENRYRAGVMGNMASHVALWKRCVAEGRPLHIAEDDAILRGDFRQAAAEALLSLREWEFVLWGWNFDWPMKMRLATGLGSVLVQSHQDELRREWRDFLAVATVPVLSRLISAAGTCCYSVSPAGARRLLALTLPIADRPADYPGPGAMFWANDTLDVEMSRHYSTLDAFVAIPCLAVSLNWRAESTVQNE